MAKPTYENLRRECAHWTHMSEDEKDRWARTAADSHPGYTEETKTGQYSEAAVAPATKIIEKHIPHPEAMRALQAIQVVASSATKAQDHLLSDITTIVAEQIKTMAAKFDEIISRPPHVIENTVPVITEKVVTVEKQVIVPAVEIHEVEKQVVVEKPTEIREVEKPVVVYRTPELAIIVPWVVVFILALVIAFYK